MFNFSLNGRPRFATSRPHEFLSEQSEFLGCEADKRAMKSRKVPRHNKSDEGLFWKSADDHFPDKRTKTWYNRREKLRISMFFFTFTLKDIYHCERAYKERIRSIVTKGVVIATLCPSFSFANSLAWRIWLIYVFELQVSPWRKNIW